MHSAPTPLPASISRLNEIAADRPFLNVAEAAPLVGLAPNTLRNRARRDTKHPLPFAIISSGLRGSRLLVHVSSLRDYLLKLEEDAAAAHQRATRNAASEAASVVAIGGRAKTGLEGKSIGEKIRDGFTRGALAKDARQ